MPEFTRKATWTVTLDTVCPVCQEYQDLYKDQDFDRWGVKIGEVDTIHAKNIWVVCQECGFEYHVDLEMGE